MGFRWKYQKLFFLPQQVLADLCGIDRTAISHAENQRRNWPLSALKFLRILDENITDLPAVDRDDFENSAYSDENRKLLSVLKSGILKDEKKLLKLKTALKKMKDEFEMLDNTRRFIAKLLQEPEIQSSELKMNVLKTHRMVIAERWCKTDLAHQEVLQIEIDELELRLGRRRAMLAGFAP